jgi:glycosyltransferase involved in cell wall biosynthesis
MAEATPLISIVLPTLNGSRYIAQSIQSCREQTYPNLEIIVVDGGSTDGTLDIVRSFADARIHIVSQPGNVDRLPGALNCGFAEAHGSLFTWLQDDDYYAPEALAVMASSLEAAADIGFVYAGFWYVDEAGEVLRAADVGQPEELQRRNSVGTCFLYRRTVAEQVGTYDPAFVMSEDSHYWLRVYQVSRMLQLPGRYYFHRLHRGSLTERDYGAYRAMRVAARARRHVLKLPWLEYQRQVADAFIQEAFAAQGNAARSRTWGCLLQGVARNPRWLTDRGVLSMGLRAVLPSGMSRRI